MPEIIYLSIEYLENLRELIIEEFSESPDPIDTGYISRSNLIYTLEQVKYMYEEFKTLRVKIYKKAAFLLYNIASKHPFSDGNKRTALVACNTFLKYNGYLLDPLPYGISKSFITKVAIGRISEKDCYRFVRKHTRQENP